jgi:hypothetical protein
MNFRYYVVEKVAGNGDGWRVRYYVDDEEVGHGNFQRPEQADEAGADFMFRGLPCSGTVGR